MVLAVLFGFAFAAVVLSIVFVLRSQSATRAVAGRATADRQRTDGAIDSLRETVAGLMSQIEELQRHAAGVPALPKPGLNLSKRSQVLRMHRRGEPPEQIAAELGVPSQEVDLLLKIHRIVITGHTTETVPRSRHPAP
jgi:hypothetical protein